MSLRDQKKAHTAAAIGAAARELLAEQGFDATTIRGIAARAGVSVGTAHNYVGSKARLVVDLLVDDLEAVMAARLSTLPEADLLCQLEHCFGGFFELYAARPNLARTCIKETMFASDQTADRYVLLTARFLDQIAGLLEVSGALRAGVEPLLGAQLCFEAYLSVVVAMLREPQPVVEQAQAALRGRLKGVLGVITSSP